jgi:ketosteroid isomerase-like protein
MSAENMNLVRRFFDTYCRGDYDGSLACLDPDVVYGVAQEAPARGREAVRAIWERWETSFEELETDPEEFIDAGEHVVVPVRYRGRGRGSGVEFDQRSYDVCTVRNGLVVRKQEFADRDEALRAAGIGPA